MQHTPTQTPLFVPMQLFLSFGQLFAALFVFPTELAMLLKEKQSDMYRLSAYYIARSVATLFLDLAYPSIFVIIIYWFTGLRVSAAGFFANWATVLLVAMVAQSIGLLLGAGLASVQRAQTAATVSMLTLILCSGFWIKDVPNWLEWVKCAPSLQCELRCHACLQIKKILFRFSMSAASSLKDV